MCQQAVPRTRHCDADFVDEIAAHGHRYGAAGGEEDYESVEKSGPATRLPWRTLALDPAVLVFAVLHAAAFATPFLYRATWRDVVLVIVSYSLRMFGTVVLWHRGTVAAACPQLTHFSPALHRHHRRVPPLAVTPLLPHVASTAGVVTRGRAAPEDAHCPSSKCASYSHGLRQFGLAWLGTASLQKGPVWWCSHHRHHHRTADTAADAHSPVAHGFWWAHCGWFLLTNRHFAPLKGAVPDLLALPEIVWLERFYLVPPVTLVLGLAAAGGGRATAYGFAVATVLCWHATYAINSVAHLHGGRRFQCQFNGPCTARNNLCEGIAAALALARTLTLAHLQAAGSSHAGRGMAQQPPPVHGLCAPRLRAAVGV